MINSLIHRFSALIVPVLMALSTPLGAQQLSLEEHILAGDVDAVERRLTSLHEQHLAGDVQADDVRVEFTKFGQTNPALPSFIENWISAYPSSPYAQAAAGWNMRETASRMRGEDYYQYVWPEGLSAFNEMMQRSQDHGWKSYNLAPDLVAASDLILVNETMFNSLGTNEFFDFIDDVMAVTPNRGTLYRAAWAFSPQWGGNVGHIATLCERNFEVVVSVDYGSVDVCIADLVMSIYPTQDLRDKAIEILSDAGWEGFESHQYTLYATSQTRGASELSEHNVVEYLQQEGATDYAVARSFYSSQFYDWSINREQSHALKVAATQLILRSKDTARAALIWDPGNADLVETILHPTETAIDTAAISDFDVRFGMWGEVLRAAPFNPVHWNAVAEIRSRRDLGHFRMTWPFEVNSIAYSNHKPHYVNYVLTTRASNYNWAQERLDSGVFDPTLQSQVYEDLLCPTIRLSRIYNALCEADPSNRTCNIVNQYRDDIVTDVFETANRERVCRTERDAPIEDLVFRPVSVDVGAYSHVANLAFQ